VPTGHAVASLQTADSETGLQALIYVSSNDGKRVAQGMEVQISPSSAPREEYGFIRGRVNYVSQFPSTPEAMLRVLGNSRLAETLAGQGAPFAVYAELTRDPDPGAGFVWSSPKGEALLVNSGTPCTAMVTVENRRPIDLVIPLIRKYLGL
jgi:HlyD family secretion protein